MSLHRSPRSELTLAAGVISPYDVIVRAEARNVDELGKLVVAQVQNVPNHPHADLPVVHI